MAIKVITKHEHYEHPDVVYEYVCPPNCPDCAAKRIQTKRTAVIEKQVKLEAKFCKKCNRWGGHDDSAAHGE